METPNWGIEPVPERLRVLGLADTFLLWTNFGISILVLVSASFFYLSLKQALLATVLGGVIGCTMLAVAALIGADARVPTMVLQRAPLGRRGSYLATVLNVLQCLGWSVFELIIIATAASALADRAFGFDVLWFWKLVFGAVATALALMGPIGFVRRFVRKFAIWAVGCSIAYLTWWIPAHADLHGAVELRRPGRLVLRRRWTWSSRSASPGSRSSPTTHASRPDVASRSGAPASATSSRRCSSSGSARSSSSRTRSAARSTSSRRSRQAASRASSLSSR